VPVHTAGGAQPFAGGVQLVAHAVALAQAYGAHEVGVGVTQAPLPSHAGPYVIVPLLHDGAPHAVPAT
jgi:hypothetical protein